MNKSWHTWMGHVCHIWMSHVARDRVTSHMNELLRVWMGCVTFKYNHVLYNRELADCAGAVSHSMSHACHTSEWVVTSITLSRRTWMSRGRNESGCLERIIARHICMSRGAYEWGVSEWTMAHMNESWRIRIRLTLMIYGTCECVMSTERARDLYNSEMAQSTGVLPYRMGHSNEAYHLWMSHVERWGAGVETQKNVRGVFGGWGRVPFNETYAPSISTICDGA